MVPYVCIPGGLWYHMYICIPGVEGYGAYMVCIPWVEGYGTLCGMYTCGRGLLYPMWYAYLGWRI